MITPQHYPLIATTADGREHLVIGWTEVVTEMQYGVPTGTQSQPVGVPMMGEGRAVRLPGELAYRLPGAAPAWEA